MMANDGHGEVSQMESPLVAEITRLDKEIEAAQQTRVDLHARLEAQFETAAALMKLPLNDAQMWFENDDHEIWVTRSTAGFTEEVRAKPGSAPAQRHELTIQAGKARLVLLDPKATSKQVIDAVRVAGLAALAGIIVDG